MTTDNAEYDFENAPCGYMSFYPDGSIIQLNRTLLNWLGFDAESRSGTLNLSDITARGTALYLEMIVYPLLRMQGYVNELSVKLVSSKGSVINCLFNASVVTNEDGSIRKVNAILFQIEERKKYEEEIFRAKETAEAILEGKERIVQSQRRIMSILGHDTKAPIVSVNRLLRMVVDGEMTREEVFPYFELMSTQLDATLILIDNLLNWANAAVAGTKAAQRPRGLGQMCAEVFALLQSNANSKSLSLKMFIDPGLEVLSNHSMISFILRNLVNNAIKFTAQGGVTVSTTVLEERLYITVSDTGQGMEEMQLEKYMAAELHSSYGTNGESGSGLGIPLINAFLEQMGGWLTANSKPGQGSDITVALPDEFFRISYPA